MLSTCTLTDWVIILKRDWKSQVHEWVSDEGKGIFLKVARQVGITISKPRYIEMNDDRPQAYDAACREVAATKPLFVMVITKNANTNVLYRPIKNVFMVENAIPNQVVTLQRVINRNKKGVLDMSKATKVALQVKLAFLYTFLEVGGEAQASGTLRIFFWLSFQFFQNPSV